MHVYAHITGLPVFLSKEKSSFVLCSLFRCIHFSLNIGLRDVGAVDFDVDLSVVLPLLLLSVERPSVPDQVDGQQEAQHTESEESNIDLEDTELDPRISHARRFPLGVFLSVCGRIHTQRGSPCRGPIIAINRGCCSRANTALTRDCMPVRLPNREEGYLETQTWYI